MNLLFAISLVAGLQTGNGSRYGYVGDTMDRVGSFACRRTLQAKHGERGWERMRVRGVAHRTLPCGTRLGLCNPRTSLCTVAYVVDRGPWGTMNARGEWHMRTGKVPAGEHYRGLLDLLPGTYTSIGLVGIERVMFWLLDARTGAAAGPQVSLLEPPSVSQHQPPIPPLRAEPAQSQGSLFVRTAMTGYPTLRLADPRPGRPRVATVYPTLRPGDEAQAVAALPPIPAQPQPHLGELRPTEAASFQSVRGGDF